MAIIRSVHFLLSNDGYHVNDTACKIIDNQIPPPPGFNENFLDGFWLGQNIPNPANGMTIINYNIPNSGEVTFTIISLLGEMVYESTGKNAVGMHKVEFDTKSLPSGLYYYSVEFKGQRLVRKMVINK